MLLSHGKVTGRRMSEWSVLMEEVRISSRRKICLLSFHPQLLIVFGPGFLSGVLVPLLVAQGSNGEKGKFCSLLVMKVWNVQDKERKKEHAS